MCRLSQSPTRQEGELECRSKQIARRPDQKNISTSRVNSRTEPFLLCKKKTLQCQNALYVKHTFFMIPAFLFEKVM